MTSRRTPCATPSPRTSCTTVPTCALSSSGSATSASRRRRSTSNSPMGAPRAAEIRPQGAPDAVPPEMPAPIEPPPAPAARPADGWRYVQEGKRDLRLDLLRGFAVFAMVADHIGGVSWLYALTGGNRFFV